MAKMVYNENYGSLPASTLRLIRRYNVSPSDFTFMLDMFTENNWAVVDQHILDNSTNGYYNPTFY